MTLNVSRYIYFTNKMQAGDLLHEFVLAMKHNIGLAGIAATIHAYPTFAELVHKVGNQFNRTRLTPRAATIF